MPRFGPIRLASPPAPFVHRRLSRESAQGLEILGHAIEYLADEYAVDPADKGPLGNADPRIAAIQMLKALNRAVYFPGSKCNRSGSGFDCGCCGRPQAMLGRVIASDP